MTAELTSTTMTEASSLPPVHEDEPSVETTRVMKKKRNTVGFSSVHIHHHRLSMGDNPAVSTGVPLTLAWDHDKSETIHLSDEPSKDFSTAARPRRIPRQQREEIAAQSHTRNSIALRQLQVRRDQRSREQSELEGEDEAPTVVSPSGCGCFAFWRRRR